LQNDCKSSCATKINTTRGQASEIGYTGNVCYRGLRCELEIGKVGDDGKNTSKNTVVDGLDSDDVRRQRK